MLNCCTHAPCSSACCFKASKATLLLHWPTNTSNNYRTSWTRLPIIIPVPNTPRQMVSNRGKALIRTSSCWTPVPPQQLEEVVHQQRRRCGRPQSLPAQHSVPAQHNMPAQDDIPAQHEMPAQQGMSAQPEGQLVSQCLTLQAQCCSLATQLQQSKVQRNQLQDLVVSMQAEASSQVTAAQHHCQQLHQQLVITQQQLSSSQCEQAEAASQTAAAQHHCQQLQQQLVTAQQQLTSSHREQEDASKLLAASEGQCIDLHQQLHTLQAQMQQQEAAARNGKQQQESHIFTLQARCASLTAQLHEALGQKHHMQYSLAAALAEAEAHSAADRQRCCNLEQQLAQQQAASEEHSTQLQAQITALQAEVQQLKAEQAGQAACSDASGSRLMHCDSAGPASGSCKGSWLLEATMFGGLLVLGCWTANKCRRRRQLWRL